MTREELMRIARDVGWSSDSTMLFNAQKMHLVINEILEQVAVELDYRISQSWGENLKAAKIARNFKINTKD